MFLLTVLRTLLQHRCFLCFVDVFINDLNLTTGLAKQVILYLINGADNNFFSLGEVNKFKKSYFLIKLINFRAKGPVFLLLVFNG